MILRFKMRDGYQVVLTRDFVERHFSNGVFPRLMGWDMDDGLTTPRPSCDAEGRYTILADMGLDLRPFLHLLRFLRTGTFAQENDVDDAYHASLCVGGIEALDAHLIQRRDAMTQKNGGSLRGAEGYNPQTPADDVKGLFSWATMMVVHSTDLIALLQQGWSVAGDRNDHNVYLRREIKEEA